MKGECPLPLTGIPPLLQYPGRMVGASPSPRFLPVYGSSFSRIRKRSPFVRGSLTRFGPIRPRCLSESPLPKHLLLSHYGEEVHLPPAPAPAGRDSPGAMLFLGESSSAYLLRIRAYSPKPVARTQAYRTDGAGRREGARPLRIHASDAWEEDEGSSRG